MFDDCEVPNAEQPRSDRRSSKTEGTNGAKVALVRVVHVRRDYSLVTKCNSDLNWRGSPQRPNHLEKSIGEASDLVWSRFAELASGH